MDCIVVTLDVLRLSGWLNAFALCRVSREAWSQGRHAEWEGVGAAAAAHAACRKAPTVQAEGRARAERTQNIHRMSVTLDVSKLSGWLNADAICRVKREAQRDEVRAGSREGVGKPRRCKQRAGRPRLWGLSVGHARSAPKTSTPCL